MTIVIEGKIWAHSGDAHLVEPPQLWQEILPADLAARMPWSERISDVEERVHIDGKTFVRALPRIMTKKIEGKAIGDMVRAPGYMDLSRRLSDLDHEGIWGEVVYASLGLWDSALDDQELIAIAARAQNEWRANVVQALAPDRLVVVAALPMKNIEDSVAEAEHVAKLGLRAVGLPAPGLPSSPTYDHSVPALNDDHWELLWEALEDLGLVAAFHVGADPGEHTVYRGPGGAVLNHTNSTYSGQRAAMLMVASGALDRHPKLRILVSEAGASWVPFLGDRMVEAYRQHQMFVRPKLSRSPREILYEQVYASFQHDESAIGTLTHFGYQNVMWGSDYPHLEGTYGHTQDTLHHLFHDQPDDVVRRITQGTFKELFPHVSDPPAA